MAQNTMTAWAAAGRQCPSCVRHSARRAFISASTLKTPETRSIDIKPESPRFAPPPKKLQEKPEQLPRLRGVLPSPRPTKASENERAIWTFLKNSASDPKTKPDASTLQRKSEFDNYKDRLTELRKRNLMQGVLELKARKVKTRSETRARLRVRTLKYKAREEAKKASGDFLNTRATMPLASDAYTRQVIPDPDRKERVAAMRARTEQLAESKRLERRDKLHTLYMHARDFIVSEDHLEQVIDREFGTPEHPRQFGHSGVSMWDVKLPETLPQLAQRNQRIPRNTKEEEGHTPLTYKRMKRIAEELTGGTMDGKSIR